eukprot:scaffold505892_cov31-Prasinocladus_malaysianus.AAC.1
MSSSPCLLFPESQPRGECAYLLGWPSRPASRRLSDDAERHASRLMEICMIASETAAGYKLYINQPLCPSSSWYDGRVRPRWLPRNENLR